MKKIVFRVDCSDKIGYGHLRRCQILASYLENDFKIFFLSKDKFEIKSSYNLITYSNLNSRETIKFCERNNAKLLVIDNYNELKNISFYQKTNKFKIIVFDDFCKIENADLIIRNNIFSKNNNSKILTGKNFYLLNYSLLKQYDSKYKFDITFYGNDLIKKFKILEYLSKKYPKIKFCLLMGLNFINKDILKFKNFTVIENSKPSKIFKILSNSKTSILPASGISMENYFLGRNTIMYIDSQNQQKIYESAKNTERITQIGDLRNIFKTDLMSEIKKSHKNSTNQILGINPKENYLNKVKSILN